MIFLKGGHCVTSYVPLESLFWALWCQVLRAPDSKEWACHPVEVPAARSRLAPTSLSSWGQLSSHLGAESPCPGKSSCFARQRPNERAAEAEKRLWPLSGPLVLKSRAKNEVAGESFNANQGPPLKDAELVQVWGGTRNPPSSPQGSRPTRGKVGTAWCSGTVGVTMESSPPLSGHPAVTEVAPVALQPAAVGS